MTFTASFMYKLCLICSAFVLLYFGNSVNSTPMLYKKNTQDKYEADLVPVSSTVIPLTVFEVSYGVGGKPSESYKQAVLKKLRKKVQHAAEEEDEELENPDTLITVKNQKQHGISNKANVKGITSSN